MSSPSHLILVTGGARAGKSRFAQRLAERGPFRRRLFIATAVACDEEMAARIARHRAGRDGLWDTLEEPVELPARIPRKFLSPGSALLLDCLPTFLTNLMLAGMREPAIRARVRRILSACRRPGLSSLFVTNEVGLGIVPEHPQARRFRDLLGVVNQEVAHAADEVHLLVAGIPLRVK